MLLFLLQFDLNRVPNETQITSTLNFPDGFFKFCFFVMLTIADL
jgi:hypothetical protein